MNTSPSSFAPPRPLLPTRTHSHGDQLPTQSSLGDSVKLLSLSTRRRLTKRRSSSVIQTKLNLVDATTCYRDGKDVTGKTGQHNDSPRHSPLSPLHSRLSSYSRRYASVDSFPETSLPYPSIQGTPSPCLAITASHAYPSTPSKARDEALLESDTLPDAYLVLNREVIDSGDSSSSLPSAASSRDFSSLHSSVNRDSSDSLSGSVRSKHMTSFDEDGKFSDSAEHQPVTKTQTPRLPKSPLQLQSAQSQAPSLVFPFSRPISVPQGYPAGSGTGPAPSPADSFWSNRSSCASMPLPMHTPYFTLPKVSGAMLEEDEWKNNKPKSRPLAMDSNESHTALDTSMYRSLLRPPTDNSSRSPELTSCDPETHSSTRTLPQSTESSSTAPIQFYPPPAPPTILTPPSPPPPLESARPRAPYEPFLSSAPASEDCWITVETTQTVYTLTVRLPGFKRDGITLATRRRRILHVVADSWEPGGGHFERRISFGYDADLTQVRAEFDGELLRVNVPRRLPPSTSWQTDIRPALQP